MRGKPREPNQAFTYNENGEAVPIIRARPFEKDVNERPTRDRPNKNPQVQPEQPSLKQKR